jgi:hypothetical protein
LPWYIAFSGRGGAEKLKTETERTKNNDAIIERMN